MRGILPDWRFSAAFILAILGIPFLFPDHLERSLNDQLFQTQIAAEVTRQAYLQLKQRAADTSEETMPELEQRLKYLKEARSILINSIALDDSIPNLTAQIHTAATKRLTFLTLAWVSSLCFLIPAVRTRFRS